jgi:hypothetical protein
MREKPLLRICAGDSGRPLAHRDPQTMPFFRVRYDFPACELMKTTIRSDE